MRLSIGTGVGPLRISQTIARSGGRRRRSAPPNRPAPTAAQIAARREDRRVRADRRRAQTLLAWSMFNAGDLCLSGVLLVAMGISGVREAEESEGNRSACEASNWR